MVLLTYLPKQRGGRLTQIATFTQHCDSRIRADAEWIMEDTLQSYDEAIEEDAFSFVGITELLNEKCTVKLMEWSILANKEIKAFKWFKDHPHRNIIQSICYFHCKDSPIKWKSKLTAPQPFCNNGSLPFVVLIQEYISGGDLSKPREWTLPKWWSMFLQITFACIEWHSNGFYFDDWNSGNILIDETTDKEVSYKVFHKTYRVRTEGICPIITDFGRSSWRTKDIVSLTDNIGLAWNILKHTCPESELKNTIGIKSIEISDCKSQAGILRFIEGLMAATSIHINGRQEDIRKD
jgi:serine/threonine protein kinase